MHPKFTTKRTVAGVDELIAAVTYLCQESCWFDVTPQPEDEYDIRVKSDREATLQFAVDEAVMGQPGFTPMSCPDLLVPRIIGREMS